MTTPSIADFQAQFSRDFAYGSTEDRVMDADITRGLSDAGMVFNENLWSTQAEISNAYLYAAAHFLVLNLQAAGGLNLTNISRGTKSHGGGVVQSKSVGSVSVNYAVPQFVQDNPILSQFMRTDYGQKYLALVLPRLVANMHTVARSVDPGVDATT